MKQEMNRFYATNNHSLRLVEFERKAICVALESHSFYRVQIKKIATEQVLRNFRSFLLTKQTYKLDFRLFHCFELGFE